MIVWSLWVQVTTVRLGTKKEGFVLKVYTLNYPELPGGYPEPEPKLTSKYRNRAGTDMPRTGTGPEPPICYPVHHYITLIIMTRIKLLSVSKRGNVVGTPFA